MRLPDRTASRAVLIGVPEYDDPKWTDVPQITGNLAGLRDVLCHDGFGGFDADRCTVVTGPRFQDKVAGQVAQLGQSAEDVFLVYYSGHAFRGSDQRLMLTVADSTGDYDLRSFTAIPCGDLLDAIRKSRARVKVVILDCCFSGGAMPGLLGDEDALVNAAALEGAYTLTSSAAREASTFVLDGEFTSFTGALIDALTRGLAEGPELVSMHGLYFVLRLALAELGAPEPKQLNHGTAGDLALVRNRSYAPGVARETAEPEYVTLYDEIGDASAPLGVRIEALEVLGRRAATSAASRTTLTQVAMSAGLPVLIRVSALCRVLLLGDRAAAAGALVTLADTDDPGSRLDRIRDVLELPATDELWRRRVEPEWKVRSFASRRPTDQALWGLVAAMVLTAAGLPIELRLLAASELADLGEPELADSLLAGLSCNQYLNAGDQELIQRARNPDPAP